MTEHDWCLEILKRTAAISHALDFLDNVLYTNVYVYTVYTVTNSLCTCLEKITELKKKKKSILVMKRVVLL